MFETNRYAIIADEEFKELKKLDNEEDALEWLKELIEANKTNGEYKEIQLVELKIVKGAKFIFHRTAELDHTYGPWQKEPASRIGKV